jgi:hypothetical protein
MTLIATRLGVVAENTLPLAKISLIQGLHMPSSPALQWSVVLRDSRTSSHDYRQGALPSQVWLLHLLATGDAEWQYQKDYDQVIQKTHRRIRLNSFGR